MRRLFLLAGLVVHLGCKRTPAVAEDAAVVEAEAPMVDAAPPSPPATASVDFTPDASASSSDRDRALASLLAGASPARDLAEQATDPNTTFDNGLRRKLTTVEVPTPDPTVSGVRAVAEVGGLAATVPIGDADRVVAGLRPRWRQCYQTGLDKDPLMRGKLTLSAKIRANGEVETADVATNTGLSPAVAQCAARVLQRAQFTAPGGSGSTLSVQITFTPAK